MNDAMPPISLEISGEGEPYVIVGERRASDLETLMELAPNLADPYWLKARAQLFNHVATGYEYDVILDPSAYEAEYMEKYNDEDPDEEVGPGVIRLTHYGIPPFSEITPPSQEGETFVFYAKESYIGIPYRVEVAPGAEPVYTPVALNQPDVVDAGPDEDEGPDIDEPLE